jgi:Family of unknown function (DUF6069)
MSLLDSSRRQSDSTEVVAGDITIRPLVEDRSTQPPGMGWWQASALAIAAAVVVNLIVYVVAKAADVSFVVIDKGEPWEVTAGIVAMVTVQALVLGFVVTGLLSLRWPGVIRLGQYVAVVFTVASMVGPVTADTDGGTKVALAVTHVVVGVACVAALEAARRRTAPTAA